MKRTYEWNPTGFAVILITCIALPIAMLLIFIAGLIDKCWSLGALPIFLVTVAIIAGMGLFAETRTRPQPLTCPFCGAVIDTRSEDYLRGRCPNCTEPIRDCPSYEA